MLKVPALLPAPSWLVAWPSGPKLLEQKAELSTLETSERYVGKTECVCVSVVAGLASLYWGGGFQKKEKVREGREFRGFFCLYWSEKKLMLSV